MSFVAKLIVEDLRGEVDMGVEETKEIWFVGGGSGNNIIYLIFLLCNEIHKA